MVDSTFEYAVDRDSRLITLRLAGNEASAWYADRIIAVYRSVPEFWLYNRLGDHRKFRGFITRQDLARIAVICLELTGGHKVTTRVAFVTRDPLLRSRVAAHSDLFPGQWRRSFTSMDDAMKWVLERETMV